MILIDDRAGSERLAAFMPSSVEHQLTRLEYSDVEFLGDGPGGRVVRIGIEYKRIKDLLQCIKDGRFSGHQLPGMVSRRYASIHLLVEGLFKADERTGVLVQRSGSRWHPISLGKRRFTGYDLEAWLTTHELKAGVKYRHVTTARQAAMYIVALYRWWNEKGWDGHNAHLQLHETAPETGLIVKADLRRRVAKELKHIGWQRSAQAASHFVSTRAMIMAGADEWMGLLTHTDKNGVEYTLGRKRAEELVEEIDES